MAKLNYTKIQFLVPMIQYKHLKKIANEKHKGNLSKCIHSFLPPLPAKNFEKIEVEA